MCSIQARYCAGIFEPKPDTGDGSMVAHPVLGKETDCPGIFCPLPLGASDGYYN
jgi:hypothetical protein